MSYVYFFYFFFGPLLTIGGLGVDFAVRLPPLLDMSLLLIKAFSAGNQWLVPTPSAVAIASGAVAVCPTFFKACRTIDGLVIGGLEWYLCRLTTARAGHVKHHALATTTVV